jgi:hypothetical protein
VIEWAKTVRTLDWANQLSILEIFGRQVEEQEFGLRWPEVLSKLRIAVTISEKLRPG